MRTSRYFFVTHLLLISFATSAHAQKTVTLGNATAELTGPWKFHIGDNPAWATPNFDDSQWETVNLTPASGSFDPVGGVSRYVAGWTAKGHPGYWGWAWYRIRLHVVSQPGEKLAVNGPADVDDAYQVFANGRLLGSFGRFSAGSRIPAYYFSQPRMFFLPSATDSETPDTIVLAFRVWMSPISLIFGPDAGGMHSAPLFGQASVVVARYQLDWLELVRHYAASPLLAALFLLLAVFAGSLFFLDRSDPVYLWTSAVFLLMGSGSLVLCLGTWTEVLSIPASNRIRIILGPLQTGGWCMVWWVWFRLRRPAWMPKLILTLTLLDLVTFAVFDPAVLLHLSRPTTTALHWFGRGVGISFFLLMAWIVLQGARKLGWEGWLVLPAVVLLGISQFSRELAVVHVRTTWFLWGVNIPLGMIGALLLIGAMFVLLLGRLLLSIRRQKVQALDIRQAQEVQQMLIPEALPVIPGFTLESEYRPAQQVGGDFFQIIAHPDDGSMLIVLGDVTGHGLQAAMMVSLLVGAIREHVEKDFDPLAMLASLNRRLLGRGHAQATCIVLRLCADGACTLANAGHLPPYLNGKEMTMEGALPLGVMTDAEFSVMEFQLQPGDRLTLLTDGLVEAQNENKELFGFDRIHELMRQNKSAVEIAALAQSFGQQDDITVVRVVHSAVNLDSPGATSRSLHSAALRSR